VPIPHPRTLCPALDRRLQRGACEFRLCSTVWRWKRVTRRDRSPAEIAEFKALLNANDSPVRKIHGVTVFQRRE